MSTNETAILSCIQCRVGNILVPDFQLCRNDFILVSAPADNIHDWDSLLGVLAGTIPNPAVEAHGRIALVHHGGIVQALTIHSKPVVDLLSERTGASRSNILSLLSTQNVNPNVWLDQLGLTHQFVVAVIDVWLRNIEIVVISTSGLDPAGMERVLAMVAARRATTPIIHVVTTRTEQFMASSGFCHFFERYTQRVRCASPG